MKRGKAIKLLLFFFSHRTQGIGLRLMYNKMADVPLNNHGTESRSITDITGSRTEQV
jgi:hypothetical protein